MQLLKDIVSFIFKLLLNLGVPAFLLWLLYKALMALALTNPWTATLIAAVLLLLWLAAAMEAGVPMVTPGCALIQYRWVRRDVCTTTTCSRACVAVKGPSPSVLGPFALFSQGIG